MKSSIPPEPEPPPLGSAMSTSLQQARERILTGLLRVCAIAGSIVFALSVLPVLNLGQPGLVLIYGLALVCIWAATLLTRLSYGVRGAVPLAAIYFLGLTELLAFGYSEDAVIYLACCALFTLILFGWRAGTLAMLLCTATLLVVGLGQSSGRFTPLVEPLKTLQFAGMLVTCVTFAGVISAIQAGAAILFQTLEQALQTDFELRRALEQERAGLERRVAERTQALADAHDEARTTSATLAAQNSYLELLREMTIELLAQRSLDAMLQQLVERATAILDVSYAELMLLEGEELVVQTATANQPFLKGDRVTRAQARLAWQAVETLQPAILDDYATWPWRRAIYNDVELHAVADFPIIVGATCIGVLAIGRSAPNYPFTPQQRAQGVLFTQLAAVMLENARLYATARHEIEERQQANVALQNLSGMLQAQNAELEAFARTVAHDLKTPLTGIAGLAQVVLLDLRSGRPAEVERMVELLASSATQAIQIVDALLLFAATANITPQLATIEMGVLVRTIPQRLHGLIESHGATLVISERWPTAQGYALWVAEVWVNYVSNAIKYGGPNPTIILGWDEPAGGQVRFWVRDHGAGLDPEQQKRLFTPFTRLHLAGASGHGLGLSIVQRIVSRLGGEVGVESAPGYGSTFSFTLPATPAEETARIPQIATAHDPGP